MWLPVAGFFVRRTIAQLWLWCYNPDDSVRASNLHYFSFGVSAPALYFFPNEVICDGVLSPVLPLRRETFAPSS